ncbi:T9SS type A sorting domain-containing protein, partial [Dysgonomonas sp. 520]|uniref:T9SS type A sorting domain-containing protein n=1 Tax=Dysgonomonas sp. 520 TaxID=2302931 RepID=UPI0013D43175
LFTEALYYFFSFIFKQALRIKELEIYGTEKGTTTDIHESQKITDIKIYPNPVSDLLSITAGSTIKSINILNLSGAIIESYQTNTEAYDISTSHWMPGTYLVKIETLDGIQVQKVIK